MSSNADQGTSEARGEAALPIGDAQAALGAVEEFVRFLGKASALRDVFPAYVLDDSSDHRRAMSEISRRHPEVRAIADALNPAIARRLDACLADDDLEGAAIACQRLYLILEPEGHLEC